VAFDLEGGGLYIFGPFGDRRTVAQASACGVALLPGSSLSRWVSQLSVLLRVFWQADSSTAGKALDELLVRVGFRRAQQARTLDDRNRGCLHLWRGQIAVCAAQVAILIAALILRIGNI
jgi:hypothetical protein